MRKKFIIVLVVLCLIMLGLVIGSIVKNASKIENDLDNKAIDFTVSAVNLKCKDTPSYAYKEDEDGTTITICRGTKPTGGYELDVKKVRYDNDTLYVYVLDSDPKGNVTMALTDPKVTIHVNKKASKIVIKGNENYKEIKKEQ